MTESVEPTLPAESESVQPQPVEPTSAPVVAPPYISNPFKLIEPSLQAFTLAAMALIKVFLMVVAAILLLVLVLGLPLVVSHGNVVAIIVVSIIALLAMIAVSIYVQWMMTRILVEAARGHKLNFTESRPQSWRQAWRLFWTSALASLAIFGGYLLFIIPGVIFSVWFVLVSYVVVAEGISGTAALKRSRELARGRFWEVAGTIAVIYALGLITFIPIIGPFAYLILSFILIPLPAVRYVTLARLKATEDWDKTRVSPMNYLAVVLMAAYVVAYTGQIIYEIGHQQAVEKTTQSY